MSLRKLSSFHKNEKKITNLETSVKPFELLVKLFTRTSNDVNHKRNESCSFSTKTSTTSKNVNSNELDFLWNFELVLIYTANLIRQKLDDLNRVNLVQQLMQCAAFIDTHLKESQSFVDNLTPELPDIHGIRESLGYATNTHMAFYNYVESLTESSNYFDLNTGQDLFFAMEVKAQIFIDKLKWDLRVANKHFKRSSIDNSSLTNASLKSLDSASSKRSGFNDEDRKLIDKLKKLEQNIDIAPPKPAVPTFDQSNLDNYLNEVEQVVKSQKEPEYDYTTINNPSVKIVNNCIMTSSVISNDILPADMDSTDDFTPTPKLSSPSKSSFIFKTEELIPKNVICERSRNFPLPPVPGGKNMFMYSKTPQMISNFPSEDVHYRKTSLKENDRSQVTSGSIANFNHRSPLRSPSLISSFNLQNNRSCVTKSRTDTSVRHSNNSTELPSTFSTSINDGTSIHSFNSNHHLLMSKQIPSIVDDPNDLLNINDMQDDIDILTRFDAFNVEDKMSNRLSEISNHTNISQHSAPHSQNSNSLVTKSNNNETYCDSEVKSDTEEYFEYVEIDGKKYRRKMMKRTVIEKIKIRKTVLAPMKADGSGPDFSNIKDNTKSKELTGPQLVNKEESCLVKTNDYSSPITPPRFRRGHEDRFRVSKSMFYPYKDEMKRLTLCNPPNMRTDANNKPNPLMNKYMYLIGKSDFEEPVIDKRFSTQLTDDVSSTWIKTSESILPHEKSKSICYLKKYREKNTEGATVHNAVRVTASRTVRMKTPENVNHKSPTVPAVIKPPAITFDAENEAALDGEESDVSLCDPDTRSSQFDSVLQSSEDEKEEDDDEENSFQSSITSDQEVKRSNRSTMEDSDFHDLLSDESMACALVPPQRSSSSDSCFSSSRHSSYLSETKDQYSFILKENSATNYLIFDDEAKQGECDIAGGPVDALIVYACDGKDHLLFLGAFLDTYRTFIEPEELILRLIIRYKFFQTKISDHGIKNESPTKRNLSNEEDDPEKKCIHVLSLLLTVIGKLKRDLTDHLNEQIQQFQTYLADIKQDEWVKAISRAINSQKEYIEKDDKIVQRLQLLSIPPVLQSEQKSPTKEYSSPSKILIGTSNNKLTILNFPSRTIAEQMTLLDWSKYRDVELMEILNLKDIVNCKLPGVIEYAKNFENVQYWTQTILLDLDRLPDRDRGCIKFLRIMKHLQRLNNYSSFIAILLAIQLLPNKKMFSKRVRSKIKEYENYMKPPRFSGYKADLNQAVSPCIPFLGIFYQDIVMLNIANPPFLELDDIAKANDKSNWSSNNNQLLLSNTIQCGRIINFWRSFKQYIFLKNCNKDQEKIRYSIDPNEKVLQFLNNFKDIYDEVTIQRMIKQMV